ncbi:MAG: DUF2946 family protein [Geminicoccaceae bacterium]
MRSVCEGQGPSAPASQWFAALLSLLLALQALPSSPSGGHSSGKNDSAFGENWICTADGLVLLGEDGDGERTPSGDHTGCVCCKLSHCGSVAFLPKKPGIPVRHSIVTAMPAPVSVDPAGPERFFRIRQARAPPVTRMS